MNFKEFNKDNSAAVKIGELAVSFNRKSGVVSFTKAARDYFQLTKGDEIVIVQDTDNPRDWYWAKKKGGFALREDGHADRMQFNNVKTVVAMMESLGIEAISFRCYLGTDGTKVGKETYFPIITLSAK